MYNEKKTWADETGGSSNFENLHFANDKFWTTCTITVTGTNTHQYFDISVKVDNLTEIVQAFSLEENQKRIFTLTINKRCSITIEGSMKKSYSFSSLFNGGGGKVEAICCYEPDTTAIAPFIWQKYLDNNKNITQLTIPGTHDTGAILGVIYSQCQNMGIMEQLESGIRFLDIRCRHIENNFAIHHDFIYQKLKFGNDVRQVCLDFLKEHPTEFIVLSVKEEYDATDNTRSFEETLKDYIRGFEANFYLGRSLPLVKDIRGKIVLLSRYADNKMGIDAYPWGDNNAFSIDKSKIKVQDVYKVPLTNAVFSSSNKWDVIHTLLEEAKREKQDWLYMNYASGTAVPLKGPKEIASDINPQLFNYFSQDGDKRCGIVIMDFPGKTLIKTLVGANFKQLFDPVKMDLR